MTSCVFAGASGPEVCSLCNNRTVGLEQVVSGPGGDANTITYQGDDGEQACVSPVGGRGRGLDWAVECVSGLTLQRLGKG